MKLPEKHIILASCIALFCSCNVIEKSSMHGFESGYYTLKSEKRNPKKVYLDITVEKVNVYPVTENQLDKKAMMTIPLLTSDSLFRYPLLFTKKSLDIDITTILLKYRPSVYGLPAQMTADINVAIYTGWRHDNYFIRGKTDPLGICHYKIINRGYDFGIFAGPGTATVGPFSTRNSITDEYSGIIIQFGLAGFIESNVASFGISTGFDYLLSNDRKVWIYNNKPWVGFIIGIALN